MRNCGYGFWENEDCRAESCRGGDERGHWAGNCCCGRDGRDRWDGTQGCGGDGRGGCGGNCGSKAEATPEQNELVADITKKVMAQLGLK